MFRKTVVIATLGTAVAAMSFAGKADAADPVLGALIGGGIGAAIGHDVNRHNGAAVGGVLGAIVGSGIAADSNRYYGERYYDDRSYAPAYGTYETPAYGYYAAPPVYYAAPPVYYAAPPVYYAAPPVYYAPPAYSVVYSSGPSYRYGYGYRDNRWRDHGYRYR